MATATQLRYIVVVTVHWEYFAHHIVYQVTFCFKFKLLDFSWIQTIITVSLVPLFLE